MSVAVSWRNRLVSIRCKCSGVLSVTAPAVPQSSGCGQVHSRHPKPQGKAQEKPAAAQAKGAEGAAAGKSLRRLAAAAAAESQLWAADHRQRSGRHLSVSVEDVDRLRKEHKAAAAAGIAEELAR